MIFRFKKDDNYVTKEGIKRGLSPEISEQIGKLMKDTPEGDVIQPLHDKKKDNYEIDRGFRKGFEYQIARGGGVYKGFARRKVKHFLTNEIKIIEIETTVRLTQDECGKELFSRIDAAMEGYKYKYNMN